MKKYIYIVEGGRYHRPKFDTLEEAAAVAHKYFLKTKIVLAVTREEVKK